MSHTRARGPRTVVGLLAAFGLIAAMAMPAAAGEEMTLAEVTGYAPGTSDNNHAETWGEGCTKLSTPEGGWQMTFELPALPDGEVYTNVIVKAGSDQSSEEGANTLFGNASAGETVWADADADGAFGGGDKNISHIIVCTGEAETPTPTPTPTPAEETATPTPTPTPTASESQRGEEETPTPTPRDDTAGGNPTPTPGTLPDTATGELTGVPATLLALVMMAALAATVYARLARQR